MNSLVTKECSHCARNAIPLTHGHIVPLAFELDNWQVMNDHHLSRHFVFLDFVEAIRFVNEVAELAEREEHHPDINVCYNTVRLDIWTHKIDGLSENDFILAAKVDQLLKR